MYFNLFSPVILMLLIVSLSSCNYEGVEGDFEDLPEDSSADLTPDNSNRAAVTDIIHLYDDWSTTPFPNNFGTGSKLYIGVEFDEDITVTGNPLLSLTTGEDATFYRVIKNRTSPYREMAVFEYTVTGAALDVSALNVASSSALSLNGGEILGDTFEDADTTLPTTGTQLLTSNIDIDSTYAVITDIDMECGAGPKDCTTVGGCHCAAGENLVFKVQFNNNVDPAGGFGDNLCLPFTLGGASFLSANTKCATIADNDVSFPTSTVNFSYTIVGGDDATSVSLPYLSLTAQGGGWTSGSALTPYLQYPVRIAEENLETGAPRESITIFGANLNVDLRLPGPSDSRNLYDENTITIDTTAPTISTLKLSSDSAGATSFAGTVGPGDSFYVYIEFSENITLSGCTGNGPNINLDRRTGVDIDPFANTSGQNYLSYQVTVLTTDSDGTLGLENAGGAVLLEADGCTIEDDAGNAYAFAETNITNPLPATVTFDTSPPQITAVALNDSSITTYAAAESIVFKVTFDEALAVTNNPQLTFTISNGEGRCADFIGLTDSNKAALFSYTIASDNSDDGDHNPAADFNFPGANTCGNSTAWGGTGCAINTLTVGTMTDQVGNAVDTTDCQSADLNTGDTVAWPP